MFSGKMKAVTFSYDDGVSQDIRLLEILNKYGLKSTFNLNSGLLGKNTILKREGVDVQHFKVQPCDVASIYEGHEVAAHTVTHPSLPTLLTAEEISAQVEYDRLALSELVGYEIVGMAYPGGGTNHNDRVVDVIKNTTGIKYARTILTSGDFEPQADLLRFKPSCYHRDFDEMFKMAERFIDMKPDTPKIFYIWGHSYEFDIADTWDKFESFCQLISGHDDIFYGTNKEILLK